MLAELRTLLAATARDATHADHRSAILQDNVLLKKSGATRQESARRLRELYALDPDIVLFRTLRELWSANEEAQPLLALLCAVARDPVLRATADLVLALPEGAPLAPQDLAAHVSAVFPGRYNQAVAARIGRGLASTWQQSGHLHGRLKKARARVRCSPETITYALLLGHLCGGRGETLFHTLWTRLLDAPQQQLETIAAEASRLGWLEYRSGGGVTEISFHHLLGTHRGEGES